MDRVGVVVLKGPQHGRDFRRRIDDSFSIMNHSSAQVEIPGSSAHAGAAKFHLTTRESGNGYNPILFQKAVRYGFCRKLGMISSRRLELRWKKRLRQSQVVRTIWVCSIPLRHISLSPRTT